MDGMDPMLAGGQIPYWFWTLSNSWPGLLDVDMEVLCDINKSVQMWVIAHIHSEQSAAAKAL